jgi:phosphate transport system protein
MDLIQQSSHISQQFDAELQTIRTHLSEMGGEAQRQLTDALHALLTGDMELASRVVADDARVNSMELSIDEECARILARRQPAASDLRLVIAVTKAIMDIERIGDESSKIARQALVQTERFEGKGVAELQHIGGLVSAMLNDALDAFARLDATLAREIIERDHAVDRAYADTISELTAHMSQDTNSIARSLSTIWALRALERIGDHACNLAQYVVYLVSGEDIRHIKSSDNLKP